MTKLKIFFIMFLAAILCSWTTISIAIAGPNEQKNENERLIFETQEISDVNKILERAKHGITDLPGDTDKVHYNISGPQGASVKKYVTTQKIKEIQKGNKTIRTYITTAIFDIEAICSTQKDEVDTAISWRNVLKMTYDRITYNNENWGEILNIESTWTRLDSQVICKDAYILAGCNGLRFEGGTNVSKRSQRDIGYPDSGYTYNLIPPSEWGHTCYTNDYTYIAAGSRSTLVRGSSSWKFNVTIVEGDQRVPDPF